MAIRSFRHKGVRRFFETGSTAGIQAKHAPRLRLILGRLNVAVDPRDMALPDWIFINSTVIDPVLGR